MTTLGTSEDAPAPAGELLRAGLEAVGASAAVPVALAAVALTPADLAVGRAPALVASFVVASDGLLSVYLASERMFGMCQVGSSGETLQVSVPLERVRRIAMMEDGMGARLTVELEADRSTVTTVFEADGSSRSLQIPAGYELIASDPEGRTQLRAFHLALVRVL